MEANFEICDEQLIININKMEHDMTSENENWDEIEHYDEIETWMTQVENNNDSASQNGDNQDHESIDETNEDIQDQESIDETNEDYQYQEYIDETNEDNDDQESVDETNEDNDDQESVDETNSNEDMLDFIHNQRSKNTRLKTQGDVKRFIEFLHKKRETRKPEHIPPETLDGFIGHFIMDLAKRDGSPYEPGTITGFHR